VHHCVFFLNIPLGDTPFTPSFTLAVVTPSRTFIMRIGDLLKLE